MRWFVLFFLVGIFSACNEDETGCLSTEQGLRGENYLNTKNLNHIDPTPYFFMDFEGFKQLLDTNCNEYKMTHQDVQKTEKIISEYIHWHDENLNPEWMVAIDDLSDYKRQYVSGITPQGDTLIYVHCYCSKDTIDNIMLHKVIPRAYGGGSGFFRLKINLNKETFYEAETNAYC